MELVIAFVSGLLALVGGFFGAWLSRRTDYESWLRRERSSAFSAFLQQLNSSWVSSVEAVNDGKLNDAEADAAITQNFIPLETQKNVVRLYLPKDDRDVFTSLVRRLWAAQSRTLSQATRMKETQECMAAIQNIFEQRLHG